MDNDTVTVYYPRFFPYFLYFTGAIALLFPLYVTVFPTMNTKGALIRFGLGEYAVFAFLFALAVLTGIAISRWKVEAGDKITFTPYIGRKRVYAYSEITKVKPFMSGYTFYTQTKKAFYADSLTANASAFFKKLQEHSPVGCFTGDQPGIF